jgi:hypothetical protein
LETVNGGIQVDEHVTITGGVSTVNGGIFVGRGGKVGGTVETVNGAIGLVGTEVSGGIDTVNGDVTVGVGSHVHGGLHYGKQSKPFFSMGKPAHSARDHRPGCTGRRTDAVRARSRALRPLQRPDRRDHRRHGDPLRHAAATGTVRARESMAGRSRLAPGHPPDTGNVGTASPGGPCLEWDLDRARRSHEASPSYLPAGRGAGGGVQAAGACHGRGRR